MASNADLPPTQTIIPIDTPPDSDRPTAAMLKADVDSGATGDKTEVFDPGMAMLGTCEEAAGTPLKPEQIALARRYETIQRWMKGSRKAGGAHHRKDGFPVAFVGFIALLAVVFVGAIAMT
ncbi:MAG TPA: hypothetical protein VGU24_12895 [Microvirga sp.]|nr:hypothetical protein [Microvirga sp.]